MSSTTTTQLATTEPYQQHATTTTDNNNSMEQDDNTSCTSSLEAEEINPRWDIGSGDIAIYNDHPKDRNIGRFLQRAKGDIIDILSAIILQRKRINYNIVLQLKFHKNDHLPVKSSYIAVESPSCIEDTYNVLSDLIIMKTQKLPAVYQILRAEVNMKQQRLRLGTYMELPAELISLKAVTHFRGKDNYCFKNALFIGVKKISSTPKDLATFDPERDEITCCGITLNFMGLSLPVEVRDVRIFEENNPTVSVNVFGLAKKGIRHIVVGPLYRTRREQETHVNLLFLERGHRTHYAYITNLAKLISKTRKVKAMAYFCNTCLKSFGLVRQYREHKADKSSCNVLNSFS